MHVVPFKGAERPQMSTRKSGTRVHLSTFIKNSPSLQLVQKKNRPEKFSFIATNNWIVKYYFAPNSSIFRKSPREEEDGENRQMQSVLLLKQTR